MSETLDTAQALMARLPRGPWGWRGQLGDVRLVTLHSGMHYLMGTDRSGMQGSQFTFQWFDESHPRRGLMSRSEHDGMVVPRADYDQQSVVDDHPLAHLIKMLPTLVTEFAVKQEVVKDLCKAAAPGLRQVIGLDDQQRALARQSLAPSERVAIQALLEWVAANG